MQLMLPMRRPGQQALIASDKSWTVMGKGTYGWQLYRCVALANGQAEWRAEEASAAGRPSDPAPGLADTPVIRAGVLPY